MKLEKRILIGEALYTGIASDYTFLGLNTIGKAVYEIFSKDPLPLGEVQFQMRYASENFHPIFFGKISIAQEVKPGVQKIICDELTNSLNQKTPLVLRHLTAVDLLDAISKQHKIDFQTKPGMAYLNKIIPYFYNLNSAREAMERFAAWGVQRGIWTYLPNKKVFWGSWADSPFAEARGLVLDSAEITNRRVEDRSFSITTSPTLRPGMKIQELLIVDTLEISGDRTQVQWIKI